MSKQFNVMENFIICKFHFSEKTFKAPFSDCKIEEYSFNEIYQFHFGQFNLYKTNKWDARRNKILKIRKGAIHNVCCIYIFNHNSNNLIFINLEKMHVILQEIKLKYVYK